MMLMAVPDNIRWLSTLYKYNMSTGGKCKYYSDTFFHYDCVDDYNDSSMKFWY